MIVQRIFDWLVSKRWIQEAAARALEIHRLREEEVYRNGFKDMLNTEEFREGTSTQRAVDRRTVLKILRSQEFDAILNSAVAKYVTANPECSEKDFFELAVDQSSVFIDEALREMI